MTEWDKRFIELSSVIASWSKDSTKVGCVITDQDNKIVATGYNGMPSWFNDSNLESIEDLKPTLITHAEVNALDTLSKESYSKELSLYVTKPPCIHCATKIAHSRLNIKKIYHKTEVSGTFDDVYGTKQAQELLESKGIFVGQIQ